MAKYTLANGWTKERMIKRLYRRNNGKLALTGNGFQCGYETGDRNHCFIGCFIPSNHPALFMQAGVVSVVQRYPDLLEKLPLKDFDALREFQSAHDNMTSLIDGPCGKSTVKVPEDIREAGKDWILKHTRNKKVLHGKKAKTKK